MTAPVSRRDRLVDAGYAAGWRLVRLLPERVAQALFRLGADRAARGPGTQQLRANLARLVPGAPPAELDRLVRAGMRSYARYWCEVFRLPSMDPADVARRTATTGREPFLAAQEHSRGVIFAVAHSGNWDVAGIWLVETLRALGRDPTFTTVAARLRPESLYRRFVAYRESLGFEVVSVEDGSLAYRALTRRLRAGGVVCLVSDLDPSGSGVEVVLAGEPARMPGGAARLAATTGAVLMPVVPGFVPGGWSLAIGAPIPVADRADVPQAVQQLADAFAAGLARHPHDWHMLQPIWTADRPA